MASSRQSLPNSKIDDTLRYFDKYDYPLTKKELIFWSGITRVPERKYFFLPGREKIVKMRIEREKISQTKWQLAEQVGERLKKFPTIQAIFVTGSLAMNNATEDDDIDLMIVTSASTLWLTRFFVNIYLAQQRRYPNQRQVSNKICPNLWLDENNLAISPHNLYIAHEIVQAKILWDRHNIADKFLAANAWVKDYLPNAYKTQNSETKYQKSEFPNIIFALCNMVFYFGQYLYMKPKMTTEKVAPGYAFFHPGK